MYEIDFTHPGKIHFIGIGGISMSGFAELLHSMGFTITGSDWHESKITKHLESLGIQVDKKKRILQKISIWLSIPQQLKRPIRNIRRLKN